MLFQVRLLVSGVRPHVADVGKLEHVLVRRDRHLMHFVEYLAPVTPLLQFSLRNVCRIQPAFTG